MKNRFQQLVDRRLSKLQWDEQRTQHVLHALEPEGVSVMKKKLSLGFALVMATILIVSVAFAAISLIYSPNASAMIQARNILIEKYGLTHTTLGLFVPELTTDGDTITYTFHDDVMASRGGNAGVYTVTLDDGEISASWTYDGIDPALWESGELDAPIWGQPQLERFLREYTNGGTLKDIPSTAHANTSTPPPTVTPEQMDGYIIAAEVTPSPGELTQEEALTIARAALTESFGLTEADMASVNLLHCRFLQIGNYLPRFWSITAWLQQDGYDWNIYVEIDASTGEIISIHMQTGGNG